MGHNPHTVFLHVKGRGPNALPAPTSLAMSLPMCLAMAGATKQAVYSVWGIVPCAPQANCIIVVADSGKYSLMMVGR